MKVFFESDDQFEIDCAINGQVYWFAICHVREHIRSKLKYSLRLSKAAQKELEEIRCMLSDLYEPGGSW